MHAEMNKGRDEFINNNGSISERGVRDLNIKLQQSSVNCNRRLSMSDDLTLEDTKSLTK